MTKRKTHLVDRKRLPVGPFQDWIRYQVAKNGTKSTADLLGMDDRWVARFVKGVETSHGRTRVIRSVSLSVVDSALTFADTDTLLQDLYPELYEGK